MPRRTTTASTALGTDDSGVSSPATDRRSTRVRSKPQPLYTPQNTTPAGKRKRGGEASDEEESEEEEDDESEEESEEEEELREPKSKGGAGGRVRKAASTPKRTPARTGKPGKKARINAPHTEHEELEEMDSPLYDALLDPDAALESTINDWLDSYAEASGEAITEMVNFILKCCACNTPITAYDVEDADSATQTLAQIQEVVREKARREYPLVSKKPEFKRFRKSLGDFLRRLVGAAAGRGVLWDGILLESLQTWIGALSSSTFRPMRHTSTVMSLNIVSALCDLLGKLKKEESTATRQLEAEQKKARANETKVKTLERKTAEIGEQVETVSGMVSDTFDVVFVHRYRDVFPQIRTECIRELGGWMLKLPSMFLEGQYLRYLGWVLSDTNAATRHEVVKVLGRLYADDNNVASLRHFTERFKPRIIEMAEREADTSVRATAIGLLNNIRARGFLESEEVEKIAVLIFDKDIKIRAAAAPIFLAQVAEGVEEKTEVVGGVEEVEGEGEKWGVWVRFKCLAEVLGRFDGSIGVDTQEEEDEEEREREVVRLGAEGKATSRVYLATTALWEGFEEMQDWENLAEYLLFDHSAVGTEADLESLKTVGEKVRWLCAPTEGEEGILLQVLRASVRSAITHAEQTAAHNKKKSDEAKNVEEEVSRALVGLLPKLMQKFGGSPGTASDVLRLQQLMKLDIYQILRQDAAYEALLDDIGRAFFKHTDENVLREAAAALLRAQTFENMSTLTEAKIIEIQDESVSGLRRLVKGKALATDAFREEELRDVETAVRRLELLIAATNCLNSMEEEDGGLSGVSVLVQIVERGVALDDDETVLIVSAMKSLRWYFMWKIQTLASTSQSPADDRDARQMRETRDTVLDILVQILAQMRWSEAKHQAACMLLDMWTLFVTFGGLELLRVKVGSGMRGGVSEEGQEAVMRCLEQEVGRLTGSSGGGRIRRGGGGDDSDEEMEEEDDDNTQGEKLEGVKAIEAERQVCELAGKIVLAVLSGTAQEKYRERLEKMKGKLGVSYDRIVEELKGEEEKEREKGRKTPGRVVKPTRPVRKEDEVHDDDIEDDD
ncbi:hypothetical protein G7K_0014-t1 [Saitoella complicata NRRL Y-17804]|uniref:SCD domain-containing protein n=1 Tax=Saitoella complicata (strain BCRC 22490 / CBS 7301 / JCM 7358 / NBRC 10748 / NRRL Y-17804) TaxID=698492 RepID=A0A0E9N742_SAICN|nr:hypothetical protein G7K_0014-t1 [Saitoella complicata NRRL Y-17804]